LSTHRFSVAILLATKNGARFLREQLDSYAYQTHRNWMLYVSDDGSSDETLSILDNFRMRTGHPVEVRPGPKTGHAENFLSLARDATISADYFAFSDQDDIWLKEKLERGILKLAEYKSDAPALYCSRTLLVNENDEKILGKSPLFKRAPMFGNALVQSLGGGNTMLFNHATKRLLEQGPARVVAHDWWTYQLVTGAGGTAIYDPVPTVRYRQHDTNAVGSNAGWRANINRMRMLAKGRFANWNEINISALRSVEGLLTPESAKQLTLFMEARHGNLFRRLAHLRHAGVYRQTLQGNIGLFVASALSKF
jgi:glycosyltransferase involved in cell wall biosynthesis